MRKRILSVCLAALLLLGVLPVGAMAAQAEDVLTAPVNNLAPKTTSAQPQTIWKFLYGKLGNEYGVAGVMGNLQAESALSSINLQNSYEKSLGYNDNSYTDAVDNGTYTNFVKDAAGYGLAQWTYWSRKQNLLNYAKSANASIGNLDMQLNFLWKELSGYTSLVKTLKSATDVATASSAFMVSFERPADQSDSAKAKRAKLGQALYDKYATNPDPGPAPVTNSMVHGKIHNTDGSLSINQQAKSTANGATRLGTIPEGATCVVYTGKASGKWYWVEYHGVQGYAYGDYITLGSAHNPTYYSSRAATCQQNGCKEYWYCAECGECYLDATYTTYSKLSDVSIPPTAHSLTHFDAVSPTCAQAGHTEYWQCAVCGNYFKDSGGSTEITLASTALAALGHDYENGVCTRCGEKDPSFTIPAVHFPQQTIYFEDQFTDVPPEQWFTLDVAAAYELGLMKGGADGTFNPYGDVTLAETIAMASRIHSIYHTGEEHFVQDPKKWYQVYLDYALDNGIISWAYYNADVTHKATRAQVAEIVAAAMDENGLYPINTIADNAIPDVKTGDAAAASIYRLYRAGILNGGDVSGVFYPKTYITRAEMAAIVSRIAESDNRKHFSLGN